MTKELQYIALFVVSGSIIKPFLINYVNTYLVNIFVNRFYLVEKYGATLHCLYRDSVILKPN